MILTGTRIYAVWGADYPALHWLGEWNRRRAVPLVAIAVQAAFAALLVVVAGTPAGRGAFDSMLKLVGRPGLPWEQFGGGFETLVIGSAPLFWMLTLLTGIAALLLRYRDRDVERPFTMPMFPLPAFIFCASCIYMLRASLVFAGWLSLIGFVPAAIGIGLWFCMRSNRAE
jgi:amino acid transporter